jgi:universal stress protein E
VNPQEEDGSISPLDSRIVETGVAFARALRVEIRVVHAWSFDIMPVLGRVSVDPERNRHAALEAHHAAAERLARFLAAAPFSIPRRNVHLLVGDPALVLQAVAAELRADAVVVGSVSRGRVTDFVSGHVDERVLSALPCSLVVVKSPEHGAVARRGPAGDAAHAHLSP